MPNSVPNYLTVDAQGKVGASFTGKVKAAGLTLDSATVATPVLNPLDSIQWNDPSGVPVQQIGGSIGASVGESDLILQSSSNGSNPRADITQFVQSANGAASMNVVCDSSLDQSFIEVLTNNQAATIQTRKKILDQLGRSDWIQAATLGKIVLKTGTVVIQLSSAGPYFANSGNFAHGLGVVPLAWANARQNIGVQVVDAKVQNQDATNMSVLAYVTSAGTPSVTTNITCDWFALGIT